MTISARQRVIKGNRGENRFMDEMQEYPYEFELRHVGGSWDNGIDVEVKLFRELLTVQCANWNPRTFSCSRWFERLQKANIATFQFDGFPHIIITTTMPVWRDHLTWEKPGRDHSGAQFRAFLASHGLRPKAIEEACRLA